MDTVKTKLRNYEKMESTMSSTLVMAQETAENVKRNAQKEAELSIREARNSAHKILEDAENAKAKLKSDLLKAEADMSVYIEKILANLKSATLLVESAKNTALPKLIKEDEEIPAEAAEEDQSANLFEESEATADGGENMEIAEEATDIVIEDGEK